MCAPSRRCANSRWFRSTALVRRAAPASRRTSPTCRSPSLLSTRPKRPSPAPTSSSAPHGLGTRPPPFGGPGYAPASPWSPSDRRCPSSARSTPTSSAAPTSSWPTWSTRSCTTPGTSSPPVPPASMSPGRRARWRISSPAGTPAAPTRPRWPSTSLLGPPCRTSPSPACAWTPPSASASASTCRSASSRCGSEALMVIIDPSGPGVLTDRDLLRTAAYVDGVWIASGAGGTLPVHNPATGDLVAQVPALSRAQTTAAIETAHRALPGWRARSAKQRAQVLRRWFDLIVENGEDLARLITLEEGKPLAESRGEVAYAASFVEWFAEEAKRIRGDVFDAPEPSRRIVVLKEPVEVCVAITPWNFPAAMITRKAAPALAAGCTMVVKPAEQTPLTALALAELAKRAGVPAGVLSIVVGDAREIGPVLTGNPIVRKVSFTGSTEIGRLLLAQSAETVKKTSMELGGNAPVLVFDDADLDQAVAGVIATKYRNTGQACISANRVYLQSGIYDRFAEALTRKVEDLVVGDGFDAGVQQGPLIDVDAVAKVEEHVADATNLGARVLCGGRRHDRGGLFFEPTVLADVDSTMRITREETFGPVTPLIRFEDESDAIRMANDTEFGLAAYLFTRDAERTWRVSAALEAGMIGINTGLISNEIAPFGGVKQSGLGREGSVYGIDEYLETKYLAWEGAGAR